MGGSETDPGMFINWSLRVGTTATRCITFNKFWPMSRDLVFDIRILELWVVKEVFMKRRNVPNRDFLSTVVMWNKIGKTKSKEEEQKKADCRDSWFPEESNMVRNDNHVEILETEERHFEPSNPSLTGTKNMDEELLMAIKNRLAGGPQFPGSLSFRPETGLRRIDEESRMTPHKPQYLSVKPSKPKKVSTHVSMAHIDDSMTAELKNQSNSTSGAKGDSRLTHSELGLAALMEGTPQLQHSTSRMHLADEGYQRTLPVEQNPQMNHSPNRTFESNEQYQQPSKNGQNSFLNHMKQSSQSPAAVSSTANSQPGDGMTRNVMHRDRNSLSLPGVPDYNGASSQLPSLSRSIRVSNDEASYNQQIHELSWTSRRNMGAILPYQQQLVRAAPNYGDEYDPNTKLSDPRNKSGNSLRDGSRGGNSLRDVSRGGNSLRDGSRGDVIRERSPALGKERRREGSAERSQTFLGDSPGNQERSKSSLKDRSRDFNQERSQTSLRDRSRENIPGRSHNFNIPTQDQASSSGIRGVSPSRRASQHQDRLSPIPAPPVPPPHMPPSTMPPPPEGYYIPVVPIPCRETASRVKGDHTPWINERGTTPSLSVSPSISPSPPPDEQTVLAMTRVGSAQMCRCGSRELNLLCGCQKEVEVIKSGECRCQRNRVCEDESMYKRRKKDNKRNTEKEERRRLKAEQKRREAEERRIKKSEQKRRKQEREREKKERERQRREQKARQKESRRQTKRKEKKIRPKNKECGMCVCCKCRDEENTMVVVPTETTECLEEQRKCKKQKKEKKPKEKKKKKTKPAIRSCECPPREMPVLVPVEQSPEPICEEPAIQGFCNHPDVPCPGLENRGMGDVRVQRSGCVSRGSCGEFPTSSSKRNQRSASNCGEFPCSSPKRIQRYAANCGDPVCPYGKRNQRCEPSNDCDCDGPKAFRECDAPKPFRECCCSKMGGGCTANICYTALVEHQPNIADLAAIQGNSPTGKFQTSQQRTSTNGNVDEDTIRYRDISAAPAMIFPNEMGHGDMPEILPHSSRSPTGPQVTSSPSGCSTNRNFLIDLSKRGRENCTNKRYVPPCVLYLDCTKVKDLCVIIKDKYEEPS